MPPQNVPGTIFRNSRRWAAISCLFLFTFQGCATGDGASSIEKKADNAPVVPATIEVKSQPLEITKDSSEELTTSVGFQLGIDRATEGRFSELRRQRVALITDFTALDSSGRHIAETFAEQSRFSFRTLVVLDDGSTSMTAALQRAIDSHPSLKVYTLDKDNFRPTDEMLGQVDEIVFDAALRGPRWSLELAALGATLEEASLRELEMDVYDRPTLTDAEFVAGPVSVLPLTGTLQGFLPLPAFHGMTTGQMARYLNRRFGIQADLTVLDMNGWARRDGNAWLESESTTRTTEGEASIAELGKTPSFESDWIMLQALEYLTGKPGLQSSRLEKPADAQTRLLLVPSSVPVVSVLERLTTIKPEGIDMKAVTVSLDGKDTVAIALTVSNRKAFNPVLVSLQLRECLVTNSREYPEPEGAGEYGDASLFDALRLGISPRNIVGKVGLSQPMSDYRRDRLEYQKYLP